MKEIVLLVGGAGFIGSHVAERYAQQGHQVIIVDDLSTGKKENVQGLIDAGEVIFHQCSILNYDQLKLIFEQHRPTVINNHAAQKSVPDSVENPIKDLNINVVGLLNLIELANLFNIKKFICASSGGALSKEILFDGDKSKETDTPQLISPYAITKFTGEKYLTIYAEKYGFEYIGLRYANVFGPRQVAEGDCGVIPIFVNNILQNKDSILMTYADMPDGCTRDYIYVEDVAEFNLLVLEKSVDSDTFNIAIGKEFTVREIFELLKKEFNSPTTLLQAGPRPGDMRRSVLDDSKARATFNWQSKNTLAEGIQKLVHSYNK